MLWLIATFATLWLVALVRAIPGVKRQVMLGRRPWACDLCMVAWVSLALALVMFGAEAWAEFDVTLGAAWSAACALHPLEFAAGAGGAWYLLKLKSHLPAPPSGGPFGGP